MSFITENGKEIEIVNEGTHRKIQFKGGGELPAMLQGYFTSIPDAEQAIKKYFASKPKKRIYSKLKKKDATSTSN